MKPFVTLLAVLAVTAAQGQARTYLNIGDPAPALKSATWVKGTPVPAFEKGKVYVVEFWATWCGPCKENIPHLTALAKKYRDTVSISGISIWESNDPKADPLPKVRAFVAEQGDKMDYNVAADGRRGTIGNAWMKAADESGIPTSFIVGRDGKIAWIGHPSNLDGVLEQVVSDKFDVEAARSRRAMEVETTRPIREAMAGKKYRRAIQLIDQAIVKKPEQERFFAYDRLVALFHDEPKAAMLAADKILKESGGDIGAYRMVVSIFASQKDLAAQTYRYGRAVAEKALAKGEMKYLFLAMSAEISASLGEYAEAVKAQEEAVNVASTDPHAPKEFVEFLRKNLDGFRTKLNKKS